MTGYLGDGRPACRCFENGPDPRDHAAWCDVYAWGVLWDGSPRPSQRVVIMTGLELRVPMDGSRWEGQVVFVPFHELGPLAEQGPWDSQFGQVVLIDDPAAAQALVAHGLAIQETRGGYHGTLALRDLLARLEADVSEAGGTA